MVHAQGAFHKLLHAALNVLATPPALVDILTNLRKKIIIFLFLVAWVSGKHSLPELPFFKYLFPEMSLFTEICPNNVVFFLDAQSSLAPTPISP